MSFLYKALLKEQKSSNASESNTQSQNSSLLDNPGSTGNTLHTTSHYGASSQLYAQSNPSSSSTVPWQAWVAIALLLLACGLLAGYIIGQGSSVSPNSNIDNNPGDGPFVGETLKGDEKGQAGLANKPITAAEQQSSESNANLEPVSNSELQLAARQIDESSAGNNVTELNNTVAEDSDAEEKSQQEQNVVELPTDNVSSLSLEQVPQDLQDKFAEALAATEQQQDETTQVPNDYMQVEVDSSLTNINDLTGSDRALIPALSYEMHIYSSDPDERWIRINNTTLYEGDRLTPYLRLAEIRQDIIIWESQDRRFSQTALEDYP